jgi:hypothetical protein
MQQANRLASRAGKMIFMHCGRVERRGLDSPDISVATIRSK